MTRYAPATQRAMSPADKYRADSKQIKAIKAPIPATNEPNRPMNQNITYSCFKVRSP